MSLPAEVTGRVGLDHPLLVSFRRNEMNGIALGLGPLLIGPIEELRARRHELTEEEKVRYDCLRAEAYLRARREAAHSARARRFARDLEHLARRCVSAETAALVLALRNPEPEELPTTRAETPPPRACLRPSPMSTCHASVAPPRGARRDLHLSTAHHGISSHPPPG